MPGSTINANNSNFTATATATATANKKNDKARQEIINRLICASNRDTLIKMLPEQFSIIKEDNKGFKNNFPNVISKFPADKLVRLEAIVTGVKPFNEEQQLLTEIGERVTQRIVDDKSATEAFSSYIKNEISSEELLTKLSEIKSSASIIKAMAQPAVTQILERELYNKILDQINKQNLSNTSIKYIRSINNTIGKKEAREKSKPEIQKKEQLISYIQDKDNGKKAELFKNFQSNYPVLGENNELKEQVLNLLTQYKWDGKGTDKYNDKVEEAVAGVLCMDKIRESYQGKIDKIRIEKSEDAYCDFKVYISWDNKNIMIGIDPFKVSEDSNFERIFLHHTDSSKSNGDNFIVIGVACLGMAKQEEQKHKISALVDKFKDRNLNLATFSPDKGCEIIVSSLSEKL